MKLLKEILEIDDKLKNFIGYNQNLINANKFDELYYELQHNMPSHIGAFTLVLLKAGINPLQYMNKLPRGYLDGTNIKALHLPNNVEYTEPCALWSTHLQKLYVPKSFKYFGTDTFWTGANTAIYYDGTKEELEKVIAANREGIGPFCKFICLGK